MIRVAEASRDLLGEGSAGASCYSEASVDDFDPARRVPGEGWVDGLGGWSRSWVLKGGSGGVGGICVVGGGSVGSGMDGTSSSGIVCGGVAVVATAIAVGCPGARCVLDAAGGASKAISAAIAVHRAIHTLR